MLSKSKFTIFEFDQLNSSSDYLKSHYQEYQLFDVIVCKQQLHGRGQYDRVWKSEEGGLFFSILLAPDFETVEVPDLILDFSKFFVQFIQKEYNLSLRIKAPNDVYYQDRKLCGVLIENSFLGSQLEYCIMGIGINLNQSLMGDKDLMAISLSDLLSHDLNILSFLKTLLSQWKPSFANSIRLS
ncbi:biotin--[acetyl-CoA-carboxylase] ligase [bacterium]|nr:biotin--[acetyl-CoA-carboxylase] ligase [bacterium]